MSSLAFTNAALPPEAEEWISIHLRSTHNHAAATRFDLGGLKKLRVLELKALCTVLRLRLNNYRVRWPSSTALKADWVTTVRLFFYEDGFTCKVPNPAAIATLNQQQEQQQETSSTSSAAPLPAVHPPQAAAPMPPGAAALPPGAPPLWIGGVRHPPLTSHPTTAVASSDSDISPVGNTSFRMVAKRRKKSPNKKNLIVPTAGPRADIDPSLVPPAGFRHPGSTNNNNDTDSPSGSITSNIMRAALRQMGFTNEVEINDGVRSVLGENPRAGPDEVMLWIVTQREEAQEARMIDVARSRSEQLRAEQAKIRKEACAKRRMDASLEELMSASDLFSTSVLLPMAQECVRELLDQRSQAKPGLIAFLEVEKNAFKWYGKNPWCYFRDVSERWKSLSLDDLILDIDTEQEHIKNAMYSLASHQGGVPKIFRRAEARAKEECLPTCPDGDGEASDESDDEVVLVKEVFSNPVAKHRNGDKLPLGENAASVEVIEIL